MNLLYTADDVSKKVSAVTAAAADDKDEATPAATGVEVPATAAESPLKQEVKRLIKFKQRLLSTAAGGDEAADEVPTIGGEGISTPTVGDEDSSFAPMELAILNRIAAGQ